MAKIILVLKLTICKSSGWTRRTLGIEAVLKRENKKAERKISFFIILLFQINDIFVGLLKKLPRPSISKTALFYSRQIGWNRPCAHSPYFSVSLLHSLRLTGQKSKLSKKKSLIQKLFLILDVTWSSMVSLS